MPFLVQATLLLEGDCEFFATVSIVPWHGGGDGRFKQLIGWNTGSTVNLVMADGGSQLSMVPMRTPQTQIPG